MLPMGSRTASEAFSSSSSPSSNRWMHDVFLSFRGDDTRKGFTGHLYMTLKEAGVNVFIDNQLRRGEEIAAELLQAIQGSRISVIVFSTRYADSSWCLEELVKIMECRRTLGQIVLPVFYDVDPSHVRNQTGVVAEALSKHERFYKDTSKVLRWRDALTEASNLSGWDLKNTAYGNEAYFIRTVHDEITTQLESTYLNVAVYQVGIESRVRHITNYLGIPDKVRMVGIWGMGGMGKTSVAKAIYNKYYHSFRNKSFLANVRETAKEANGMLRLQEKLLSDISKSTKVKVDDVHRGINLIKERLRRGPVLIIVDDVDHMDQLHALAINHASFLSGSRIIITTRDRHILVQSEVNLICPARTMNDEEALQLFSWHAFRNHCPNEGYFELSRSVLSYCGGLPLALEVLGSFLFKRSTRDWTSTLKKLEKIPHSEIQKKLKISFDALSDEENERDIFLDICCFFIGMDRNYVTRILDGCGFFADIGLSVLLQRCLITVDEKNKIMMHDLLRDMGREIVRAKFPNNPGKCSRLWRQEDAIDVLKDKSGTAKIEGLALNLLISDKASFSTKAFAQMKRLRLLQLSYVQLTGDYEHLSEKLRWLCWFGFPLKFIPNDAFNQLQNLVSIDLRYSNLVQFWEDSRLLAKLKILNLSHSHYLTESPDFVKLPNLEYLILKDCKSLSVVHHSIGKLENLGMVNLKDCIMLKDLPNSFYKLKCVETLVLSGCSSFENLMDVGEMVSLKTLLIDNTAITEIPYSSIIRLKNLTSLSLRGLQVTEPNPFVWPLEIRRKYPPQSQDHLTSSRELQLPTDDPIAYHLATLVREVDLYSNEFCILPRCTSHSLDLVEFPGIKESLISCAVSQGQTSSEDGGTFLAGNESPKFFISDNDERDRVYFQVPQVSSSNLKGLTVCIVYSSGYSAHSHNAISLIRFSVMVTNHTKLISFIVRPMDPYAITSNDVIWQGHFSNNELYLEGGDSIEVYIIIGSGFWVKKTGVRLVWDPINENMNEFEPVPYPYVVSDDPSSLGWLRWALGRDISKK